MAKQKIEIEVDVPEGYECTGEFRAARKGEIYLNGYSHRNGAYPVEAQYDHAEVRFPILRKAEVWVQLTVDKAIELYKTQKPVTYRYKCDLPCYSRTGLKGTVNSIFRSMFGYECVSFNTPGQQLEHRYCISSLEYLKESE